MMHVKSTHRSRHPQQSVVRLYSPPDRWCYHILNKCRSSRLFLGDFRSRFAENPRRVSRKCLFNKWLHDLPMKAAFSFFHLVGLVMDRGSAFPSGRLLLRANPAGQTQIAHER